MNTIKLNMGSKSVYRFKKAQFLIKSKNSDIRRAYGIYSR